MLWKFRVLEGGPDVRVRIRPYLVSNSIGY